MLKKKAFTLSELLIALAIVGALAALSIPAVVENMNRKIMASQLKNLTLTIQNLVGELKVNNNTQTLERTPFADPNSLLSPANFVIADNCAVLTNCYASSYKTIKGDLYTFSTDSGGTTYKTVKLKNGVTLSYGVWVQESTTDDPPYGIFRADLNGIDKPNILGRDLFVFRITQRGKIVNGTQDDLLTDEELKAHCLEGTHFPTACYTLLERNNWQITF